MPRKTRIMRLLKQNFGLIATGLIPNIYLRDRKTNEVIITTQFDTDLTKGEIYDKYQINVPDLVIKSKPRRIIELDGSIHGLYDKLTESEQTSERNTNYKLGGFNQNDGTFVIITSEDEKLNDDDLSILLRKKLKLDILP